MYNKIAVLNVLYNDAHHVSRLIKSLKSQTYKNFDIYAIETSESGSSMKLLKELYPDAITYPYMGNLGFAAGNNFLAGKAMIDGNDFLFVLNTDMELDSRCLEALIDLSKGSAFIGGIAPIVFHGMGHKRTNNIQCYAESVNFKTALTVPLINYKDKYEDLKEIMEVNIIHGGASFINIELYKEIGLFNEDYFMYGDERDLAFRVSRTSYKLYVTKHAICWHHHDRSKINKEAFRREYFYRIRNRMLFLRKNGLSLWFIRGVARELIKIPNVFIWSIRRSDLLLFYYYYLGLLQGIINMNGKSSNNFK